MVFQCQRDSWARQFRTRVLWCRPAELPREREAPLPGFNVGLALHTHMLLCICKGQGDLTQETHVLIECLTTCMQYNSELLLASFPGQHLITAIADLMFGFKTTSWELGRQRSVIELDTPSMTREQVVALEENVNEKVRAHIPVTVKEFSDGDPEVEMVRTRGLPDDHAGPVRIVSIEDIDDNMCCGTHVSNLSQLQVIKLLGTEKGKKNKTNLVFLVGNRVLKSVERSHSTEKTLTSLLKNGPEEHVEAVKRLQNSVKMLQKNNLNLLRDLAVLTAQSFKSNPNRGQLFVLHRKDGDTEFMNIIANEIGMDETLLFLTVGDEKEAGLFLLAGPIEIVENLGPR
uniref:Alanyl-tRNA synthetase domain containing 1 n=1 Tax=Crocodylus porosus TaxID=8502 RepID=A0A7M4ELJ3_CROPO